MAADYLYIQEFNISVKIDPYQEKKFQFKSGRACSSLQYYDNESFPISLLLLPNTIDVPNLFRCLISCNSQFVLRVYACTLTQIICEPVVCSLNALLMGKNPSLFANLDSSINTQNWSLEVEQEFNPFMRDVSKGIQELHIIDQIFNGNIDYIALVKNTGSYDDVCLKPMVAKIFWAEKPEKLDFERDSRIDVFIFRRVLEDFATFPLRLMKNLPLSLEVRLAMMGFRKNNSIYQLMKYLLQPLVFYIPPTIFLEDPSLYSHAEKRHYLSQLSTDVFFYDKHFSHSPKPLLLAELNSHFEKGPYKSWKTTVRSCKLVGAGKVKKCLLHGIKKVYNLQPLPRLAFETFLTNQNFDKTNGFEDLVKFYHDALRHKEISFKGQTTMVDEVIPKLDLVCEFPGMTAVHRTLVGVLGPRISKGLQIPRRDTRVVAVKGRKQMAHGLSIFARLCCRRMGL